MPADPTAAFEDLLRRFVAAVAAADGPALAALFTADGVYDDYLFGPHQGAASIAAMVARFYEGGEDFRWEFLDAMSNGRQAYAAYRFSYRSKVPESAGQRVGFEGMSHFELQDGRIRRYHEVFDRGLALTAIGLAPARIQKILSRHADRLYASPGFASHR